MNKSNVINGPQPAAPVGTLKSARAQNIEPPGERVSNLLAFAFLYAQLAAALWIVPDWSPARLGEPVFLAAWAGVATTLVITAIRLSGLRGSWPERVILSLFLGGMPLVYLSSLLLTPQPGWFLIELAGLAVFGTLAVLGLRKSAMYLALGIIAHGLLWDLGHHGRTLFIPNWYTVGCLTADIGLGLYTALQARYFDQRV